MARPFRLRVPSEDFRMPSRKDWKKRPDAPVPARHCDAQELSPGLSHPFSG
jgi:hypothetical protein